MPSTSLSLIYLIFLFLFTSKLEYNIISIGYVLINLRLLIDNSHNSLKSNHKYKEKGNLEDIHKHLDSKILNESSYIRNLRDEIGRYKEGRILTQDMEEKSKDEDSENRINQLLLITGLFILLVLLIILLIYCLCNLRRCTGCLARAYKKCSCCLRSRSKVEDIIIKVDKSSKKRERKNNRKDKKMNKEQTREDTGQSIMENSDIIPSSARFVVPKMSLSELGAVDLFDRKSPIKSPTSAKMIDRVQIRNSFLKGGGISPQKKRKTTLTLTPNLPNQTEIGGPNGLDELQQLHTLSRVYSETNATSIPISTKHNHSNTSLSTFAPIPPSTSPIKFNSHQKRTHSVRAINTQSNLY